MYIKMNKITENLQYVCYSFETIVAGNVYFDNGKPRRELIAKYGYCKFSKLTEEFELDITKTDEYFLTKDNREAIKVKVQLILCKRNNLTFPDIIDIATG